MLEHTPVISAIMPVYKTPEAFLRSSIESVLKQTYGDFELILVEDGSPDSCGDICDAFAEKDKRVKVIHQTNQGPSAARNAGIAIAKGSFLTFVDSDDVLVDDAWARVMEIFENPQVDCAVFGWVDIRENGSEFMHPVTGTYGEIPAREAMKQIASDNYSCGGGYPWNKFWRRQHICGTGEIPAFNTEIYTYEDKLWVLEALEGMNRVALMPDILYEYRQVETSLTHDAEAWARRQFNAYEAYDRICDKMEQADREAYEGALGFYFEFCRKDTQITKEDRWRDEGRYRRTRKQLITLCQRMHLGQIKGLKLTLIWLYYWLIGLFTPMQRKAYAPGKEDRNLSGLRGHALFIDVLRVIASFCVVWEHFGNEVHWYDGSAAWKMCVPIQSLCFWAVPALFMITGATEMTYRGRRSTTSFFKQRILRVGLPYVFWALVALFVNLSTGKLSLWGGPWGKVYSAAHAVLGGTTEAIYWLFIPLFAIYLAMPGYSLLARSKNRPVLRYALAAGVATIVALPTLYNLLAIVKGSDLYWNGNWALPLTGGFAIYALTGYWACTHDFTPLQRKLCYAGGILCVGMTMLLYYGLTPRLGHSPSILSDYLNMFAWGAALAAFVACRYIPWESILRGGILYHIVRKLSQCSFGIFLTHIFVLHWMEKQAFFGKYTAGWYFLWPIGCYCFCAIAVYLLKKIPLVRRLLP